MILNKKNMYSPKQENIDKLNIYLKNQEKKDIEINMIIDGVFIEKKDR